jgi:hypothetical protein
MSDQKRYDHDHAKCRIGLHGLIIIVACSFVAGCLIVGFSLKPALENATYEAQHYRAKAMEMEARKNALERVLIKREALNAAKDGKPTE